MLKFVKAALVVKTHGYKGDIVLKKDKNISNTTFEECLEEGNAIFVEIDGIPVPFFISDDSLYFFEDNTVRLHLDDINNVEKAQEFIGNPVFFIKDCLKENSEASNPHSWINFKVNDKSLGFMGTVVEFNDEIAQNPLIIVEKDNKNLLIPYNETFIIEILLDNKEIITELPAGFLDLYH